MDEAKLIDARRRFGPANSQLMEPTCFPSTRGRDVKPVSEVNFSNPVNRRDSHYDRNRQSPNFYGSNRNSPSRYENSYRRYDDRRRSPDFVQHRQSYSPYDSNRRFTNFSDGRRSPYQEQTRQANPPYDYNRRSPNWDSGRRSPNYNQGDRRVHFSNAAANPNYNRGRGACWNCDGTDTDITTVITQHVELFVSIVVTKTLLRAIARKTIPLFEILDEVQAWIIRETIRRKVNDRE